MAADVASRRFPAPWTFVVHQEAIEVRDANGQSICWLYFEDEETRRSATRRLTRDEARRIAANIIKLPELLKAAALNAESAPRPEPGGA
jgi:hypothetical protein